MTTRYTVIDDFIPDGMPRCHIAVVSERDAGHTLRRAIALTGPTHGYLCEQSLADAHRIAAALNAHDELVALVQASLRRQRGEYCELTHEEMADRSHAALVAAGVRP